MRNGKTWQGDPIDGGYAGISLADYHYPKFHDSEKWEDATSLSYEPDADGIIPIIEKAIRFYAGRMEHDEYRLSSFEQVSNINRLLMENYKEYGKNG